MLHEKQMEAAKRIAEGHKITDVAKFAGVNRKSIYEWQKNEEFISEVDRQVGEIKTQADRSLNSNVDTYIKELEKIAFGGRSEKTKADVLMYLTDRVLGKSTTKVEDVTEKNINKKDKVLSWDDAADVGKPKLIKKAK